MAITESTSYPGSTGAPGSLPESDLSRPRGTSDGGSVVDRVARGAHEAVDRFADKARPAVERMRGSMSGAGDSMHERADQLGEMQEQWMESCRTAVREHPIASIGVAVVAGMVLSKVLSSR